MRGTITRRGRGSWRLKFDAERDASGARNIKYATVRGTKKEAQQKLAELVAAVGAGSYVEPSKITVGAFVSDRIAQWEAAGDISGRTATRYRELAANQIAPELGAKLVQKLKPLDVENWHTALRATGISARTIGHAHRVLAKALRDAERNEIVVRNVAKTTRPPRPGKTDMVICTDVPALVDKLKGARLETVTMVALFTGMRLGEVLALRWDRIDLDRATIRVVEAVEYTKAAGLRIKEPKSAAGVRTITAPGILVDRLRDHRRAQQELRLRLGMGRLPDAAHLLSDHEGVLPTPNSISSAWRDAAPGLGVPGVTFHALRHTHASQLIDAGVDICTIAKRLGHADAAITLRVYAHLFRQDDSKAAAAIDAAFARKG